MDLDPLPGGAGSDETAGLDCDRPSLSIVVPVRDEVDNLEPLREQTVAALEASGRSFEIIFVDDGSHDGSSDLLDTLVAGDERLRVIHFSRNFGQTAAIVAGVDHARGDVIVPMDADRQNDPRDIPLLVDKLEEGYDVVSGWRRERKDHALTRRLPSVAANRLISWISGVRLNDYGCSLKAYRRDTLANVRLYGEMHRFIPVFSSWLGGRITELPVRHHARVHGRSKYGANRLIKVLLDLIVIVFLERYNTKPIYVFGTVGFMLFACAGAVIVWALVLKVFYATSLIQTPLPLLSVMCFITGVISVLMGLLAELLTRIYYESQNKPVYVLRSPHMLRSAARPPQGPTRA